MNVGTVFLRVKNLNKQIRFYEQTIGLQVQREDGETVYLGVGDEDLVALIHTPDGQRYRSAAGLYHFALLVPERYHLALTLQHFNDERTPLQGVSDHFVSEAVYLPDVEGNGIEIYADRPRKDWYVDDVMQITVDPLDLASVMHELVDRPRDWRGLPSGTVMGHMHLHVASVEESITFYTGLLNMELMVNAGSAAFLAYDGYHHHLGANVWGGRNTPPDDALGLNHFNLHVDEQRDIILEKLNDANYPLEEVETGWLVKDPVGNRIVLL